MSASLTIRDIPIEFPFQPYDIQKDYMEKVIECIQNETTAVLESPTGTGKTLSLLCSTLAWLQLKKTQIQAQREVSFKSQTFMKDNNSEGSSSDATPDFLTNLLDINGKADNLASGREFLGLPRIIYASRTHSQLAQAIQEMKRTAYSHMKAIVIGSRDQLCIHPELLDEKDSSLRLHMCRLKLTLRSCIYNSRVDKWKTDPQICNVPIIDIEDMVKLGQKHTFCPYFMTKELKENADIIFTPYNYLLDPVARKALGLKLVNSIVILDEGHNVEKVCEESASIDIKSTDIALAIDEVTSVMKMLSDESGGSLLFEETAKGDIDPENVATLKQTLIEFEKVLDDVPLITTQDGVTSFPGDYIYELLEKVQITSSNCLPFIELIEKIIQFLTAQNDGPFARKGKGLQLFADFLTIVFSSKASKEKIRHCYKVHVVEEDLKKQGRNQVKSWLDKGSTAPKCRTLSFWCFSPGFGMDLITSMGVKALILTSGTLAPLKPLIAELELDVRISLENPHIVKDNQVCVKILTKGPDGEPFNSSYRNRDNVRYVTSLGRTIVNLSRIIPSGLLVFFPSYPIMQKCQTSWELEGIWANIASQKAIFVEPRGKEAFNAAMRGYYEKIRDPNLKGAIFMAVCRGKVSEGLDFADANGRAVIITGLPYPPLKDPKVILKRRYLDSCHALDKEYLTGQNWYCLEASRAVNQAIGRVIRHRHDYGAILLLDERFNSFQIKEQMSKWLRHQIKVVNKYGEIIRDLSQFFRKAQSDLPAPQMKPLILPQATFEAPHTYRKVNSDGCSTSSVSSQSDNLAHSEEMVNKYLGTTDNPNGTVQLHKRDSDELLSNTSKRKRFHLTYQDRSQENRDAANNDTNFITSMKEYVLMVKSKLGRNFTAFAYHLKDFRDSRDMEAFIRAVDPLVPQHLRYIFIGMDRYILEPQRTIYRNFLRANNLTIPEDL